MEEDDFDELAKKMNGWRYQAVWFEGSLLLIEVHLSHEGELLMWSDLNDPNRTFTGHYPTGNDIEDMIGTIELMLSDTKRWAPIKYEDLKVGMIFNGR